VWIADDGSGVKIGKEGTGGEMGNTKQSSADNNFFMKEDHVFREISRGQR
jgi:hypothetical protein